MIAVIGDVHGCYYTLQNLVEKIKTKYPGIKIYCVGDLVDRGNYSLEVIDFMLEQGIEFTRGNHDVMFYSYYKDPFSSMGRNWMHNGAPSTIQNYEEHPEKLNEHLDSILKAPLFIDTEDAFISHAGISSIYANQITKNTFKDLNLLNEILERDLSESHSIIWCRSSLMNIGKLQIVGHTHRKETFFDEQSNTFYIDTTAFGQNKLSSVIVDKNKILEIIDQPTSKQDADGRWKYYL